MSLSFRSARSGCANTLSRAGCACRARRRGGRPIVKEAPLLCLEVLSPRDSVSAIRKRAQQFLKVGVSEVWVFDPQMRIAYVCTADSMTEQTDGVLRLEGTQIELSLADAFKPLKR